MLVAIRKTLCDITLSALHRFLEHGMRFILTSLIIAVYLLHQDLWFWGTARPLVFGFLPIGLFYHAAFCLLCSAVMILLVKFAWPFHFDEAAPALLPEDEGR
jgi:hypothetical protein